MRKQTLSRFFLGLIFGSIAGIIVYSLELPTQLNDFINRAASVGMNGFNIFIGVLIWPMAVMSFADAFYIMWEMIRAQRQGVNSIRTYLTTSVMAVLLTVILGQYLITPITEQAPFASWIVNREKVLLSQVEIFKYLKMMHLEVICMISALYGIILAERSRKHEYVTKHYSRLKRVYDGFINFLYQLYYILPVMIFFISMELTAQYGGEVLKFVLIFGLLSVCFAGLHAVVVYSGILLIKLNLNPRILFKKCFPLIQVAGWTINSKDAERITIRTAILKLGVPESIATSVIKGGTTLNMDGTAIMQAVALILTAAFCGIPFTGYRIVGAFLFVVVIAMVTTAGTLTGMFTLGIVFFIFDLPLEFLAIIISISHVISTIVTPVNIIGDLVSSMVIADEHGALNREKYWE